VARHRTQGKRRQIPDRYTESRYAWAQLPKFEVIIYHGDGLDEAQSLDETDRDDMEGLQVKPIRLLFRYPNVKMSFNFTAWSEKELDAFSEMVNHAIDIARPAVRALDARAYEEFQAGKDDNPRTWRPEPVVVYRDRLRPDYSEMDPTAQSEMTEEDWSERFPDGCPGCGNDINTCHGCEGGADE